MEIRNLKVYGLRESIERSGYPKSFGDVQELIIPLTLNDSSYKRASHLGACHTGEGHDCFLKGIVVQFDLKYTQYFSMQMERYHWFDIISSQSKMHTITQRGDIRTFCNRWVDDEIINRVNFWIHKYNDHQENNDTNSCHLTYSKEEIFMKIISNMPMGFELWAGITTNYLQLKTIYQQRKNHKLPEWKWFCEYMENELPMFKDLISLKTMKKLYNK